MKPEKCGLYDSSWDKLSDWADFQQPVPAYFLSTFRDIRALQILDSYLIDFLFIVLGKTQRFDSFEHIYPKLFNDLHDVSELQRVKFLDKISATALEVSWSNLQAWMVTCKLPTLSFSFHLVFNSFFMFSRIFTYVLIEMVVFYLNTVFTVYFCGEPWEIEETVLRNCSSALSPWLPKGFVKESLHWGFAYQVAIFDFRMFLWRNQGYYSMGLFTASAKFTIPLLFSDRARETASRACSILIRCCWQAVRFPWVAEPPSML